jgi:hypothetical protein
MGKLPLSGPLFLLGIVLLNQNLRVHSAALDEKTCGKYWKKAARVPSVKCIDKSTICGRVRDSCCEDGAKGQQVRDNCPATCGICRAKVGEENLKFCLTQAGMTGSCRSVASYDPDVNKIGAYLQEQKCIPPDAEKYVACMVAGRDLTRCCFAEGAGDPCGNSICKGVYNPFEARLCIQRALRYKVLRCVDGTSQYAPKQ